MDYDYLYENGKDWQFLPPYMRSADEYDGITIEEKETKEMISYKVGDIVNHPLYNESIIVNLSNFEKGFIKIVPLTGIGRGQIKTVLIDNVKHGDNKLIISIKDYNEMANTIENLKKEHYRLKGENINLKMENEKLKEENWELKAEAKLAMNAIFGYNGYKLPEIKSVLYHKPATIIF